jgi:hypothetical protein
MIHGSASQAVGSGFDPRLPLQMEILFDSSPVPSQLLYLVNNNQNGFLKYFRGFQQGKTFYYQNKYPDL